MTLDPTQSVTIYVNFDPSTAGSLTGSLMITSNATNSTVSVPLSGTGVAVAPQTHSVGLTWVPSVSAVTGYFVYRGPSVGSLVKVSPINAAASYTDQGVAGGQTYVYAVTSVNSSNVESGFSNEVSVTIP